MDTPMSGPGDFFPPELMRVLGTARRVIDQHVNDHGFCSDCGFLWPCQHAQLADLALSSL
jgi:hypothetical protein